MSLIQSEGTRKALQWILVTTGAALIGVFVTSAYESARPSVSIVAIQPSVSANDQFVKDKTPIAVPASLAKATVESDWAEDMRGSTMPYSAFEDALDENEHRLNRYFEDWNQLQASSQRMRFLLERGPLATDDEKVEFYDLWERNDNFIYAAVLGDFRRGTLSLSHRNHTGPPVFQLYQEAMKNGTPIWVVNKKGGSHASILVPTTDRDIPFNKEVAEDLAFLDSAALLSFLDECEKPEISGERINKTALEEVFRARRALSRWTVQIAISNRGDSPIAFLPQASLHIDTSNLIVAGKPWGKSTDVRLEHRDNSSELDPIYLDKGSAKLVKYSSILFIRDIEPAEALVQAYDLGGFDCTVQLFTVGGGVLARSKYQTAVVKFVSSGSSLP